MNRKLMTVLLVLAALCLIWCMPAMADDWEYDVEEGTDGYKVLSYNGHTAADVTVPGEYNGKPVVALALESFAGHSELQTVRIPSSVVRLGESAFDTCSNLTAVLPADGGGFNVKTVNICTFYCCEKLTNISTLLNRAEAIRCKGFYGCESLKTIDIPENVKEIEEKAFSGCTSLTDVTIRNKNMVFGKDVFLNSAKVVIHGYIGSTAEAYASANGIPFEILDAQIPHKGGLYKLNHGKKTATLIGTENKNIKTLKIPDSILNGYKVTAIGAKACRNLKKLTTLTIGKNVTKIGSSAFENCKKLKTVTIKNAKMKKSGFGSKCFKGINAKATFRLPGKMSDKYKAWIIKKSKAPAGITVKKGK